MIEASSIRIVPVEPEPMTVHASQFSGGPDHRVRFGTDAIGATLVINNQQWKVLDVRDLADGDQELDLAPRDKDDQL